MGGILTQPKYTKLQAEVASLEKILDKKYFEVAMLRAALEAAQWGFNHARCPVCAGFDGETERDHVHNETCIVGNALAYGKRRS